MKTSFLALALLFILGWANAQPGSISNIQVTQGTGEYQRVVDILFDLSGNDPMYYLSLEISFDNGNSYEPIDPFEVSGSVYVSPGTGIPLRWDGRVSYPTSSTDHARLKIIATTWQCGNPITDSRDGQIYNTVKIGSQCWMAENLNIGTRIDGSQAQSDNAIIEKYCILNDENNCDLYGGMYRWDESMQYTTVEGGQGICPPGWHLPGDEEWKQLEGAVDTEFDYPDPEWDKVNELEGLDAGTNLKSSNGWNGMDLFGFTALPGGMYSPDGGSFFYYGPDNPYGSAGYWWTSTENDNSTAWLHMMHSSWANVARNFWDKQFGWSVRCVKD